jgi:hypothetical protein
MNQSNNQTQGASIEAERAANAKCDGCWGECRKCALDELREECATRRTPAAAAGAGELPPLDDGAIMKVADSMGIGLSSMLRAFAKEIARAAIAADRAQRKQADGAVIDYGAPAAPASAQPADPIEDLWIHEDMARDRVAAAASFPRKDLKAAHAAAVEDLLYWRRRALTAEAPKAGAQPDQRESAAEGKSINLSKLTRWTFDGGMTAQVSKDGQWVAFKDLEWRLAAAPSPAAQPVAKDDGGAA